MIGSIIATTFCNASQTVSFHPGQDWVGNLRRALAAEHGWSVVRSGILIEDRCPNHQEPA